MYSPRWKRCDHAVEWRSTPGYCVDAAPAINSGYNSLVSKSRLDTSKLPVSKRCFLLAFTRLCFNQCNQQCPVNHTFVLSTLVPYRLRFRAIDVRHTRMISVWQFGVFCPSRGMNSVRHLDILCPALGPLNRPKMFERYRHVSVYRSFARIDSFSPKINQWNSWLTLALDSYIDFVVSLPQNAKIFH